MACNTKQMFALFIQRCDPMISLRRTHIVSNSTTTCTNGQQLCLLLMMIIVFQRRSERKLSNLGVLASNHPTLQRRNCISYRKCSQYILFCYHNCFLHKRKAITFYLLTKQSERNNFETLIIISQHLRTSDFCTHL